MNYSIRLASLLLALVLLPLTSCTTARPKAQYWQGFSGPAYLPGKLAHPPKP